MENERNTSVVGNHERAMEFKESVSHILNPIEQWVNEDNKNRSYVIILSRKEEGEENGINSVFNMYGKKTIVKTSVARAMEVSDDARKMIIDAQKMFVARTIERIMSESDDDDEIEPEVDYDDRGEEVDDTDKPEGGER